MVDVGGCCGFGDVYVVDLTCKKVQMVAFGTGDDYSESECQSVWMDQVSRVIVRNKCTITLK
jgi:hypothetical protein